MRAHPQGIRPARFLRLYTGTQPVQQPLFGRLNSHASQSHRSHAERLSRHLWRYRRSGVVLRGVYGRTAAAGHIADGREVHEGIVAGRTRALRRALPSSPPEAPPHCGIEVIHRPPALAASDLSSQRSRLHSSLRRTSSRQVRGVVGPSTKACRWNSSRSMVAAKKVRPTQHGSPRSTGARMVPPPKQQQKAGA